MPTPPPQHTREELIALARRYLDTVANNADEEAELADLAAALGKRKATVGFGVSCTLKAHTPDGAVVVVPHAVTVATLARLDEFVDAAVRAAIDDVRMRHEADFHAASANIIHTLQELEP